MTPPGSGPPLDLNRLLEVLTRNEVSWFNEKRPHGELGDRTPSEVEAEYSDSDQTKAA